MDDEQRKAMWASQRIPRRYRIRKDDLTEEIYSHLQKDMKKMDYWELQAGRKEEMEHTKNPAIAERIAMDHLEEDPQYYSKLKRAGLMG